MRSMSATGDENIGFNGGGEDAKECVIDVFTYETEMYGQW